MARRLFFAFHYERDIWRAGQVRNSWLTKPDREAAGFWDTAGWEKVKKEEDEVIERWIDNHMKGTSVTAVLIGAETSGRKWVRYEIKKSHEEGKGLLGLYIHNMKDDNSRTDTKGDNNFGEIGKDQNGNSIYFYQLYPTYDWVNDNGYENFGDWVEKAAKKAGK
jgi:hypothetical protein